MVTSILMVNKIRSERDAPKITTFENVKCLEENKTIKEIKY
jgi:hypothetical protein